MLFRRISDVNLKYIAIGLGPVVLGAAIFFKYRIESLISPCTHHYNLIKINHIILLLLV